MDKRLNEQARRVKLRQKLRPGGWNSASLLIKKAIARYDLKRSLTAADVCQIANDLGQKQWRAVSFQDSSLKILVPDYETVAQIKLNEAKIIAQINARLADDLVKSIVCQLHWSDESDSLQP